MTEASSLNFVRGCSSPPLSRCSARRILLMKAAGPSVDKASIKLRQSEYRPNVDIARSAPSVNKATRLIDCSEEATGSVSVTESRAAAGS
jgi:hypothetical protein